MTEQAASPSSRTGTGVGFCWAAAASVDPGAASGQAGAASGATSAVPPAPDFSWGGYFEAIGIMLLLLGLLWLAAWAVRRYGKWNFIPRAGSLPRDALLLETQLPLGPKKGLAVVRFLNTRLLLGITEQQITVLKETDLHEQQDDRSAGKHFAQILDDAAASGPGACGKSS